MPQTLPRLRLHDLHVMLAVTTTLLLPVLASCDATPTPSDGDDDEVGEVGGGAQTSSAETGAVGGSGGGAPPREAPTPWTFDDEDEAVSPLLDAAARGALLREALEAVLDNPIERSLDLHTRLLDAARDTDDGCPAVDVTETEDGSMTTTIWYGPCEDEAGIAFFGSASTIAYRGFIDPESGRARTGRELSTIDAEIEAADGSWFGGAFYAGTYDDDLETSRLSFHVFQGTIDAGEPGADGEPERVLSPAEVGVITHHDVATLGVRLMYADGAIAIGERALTFSDFTIGDATAVACPEEPAGHVAIRDVDGNAYDVAFDGLDADGAPTPACDACGVTSFRGAELEPSCVETDSLLDLENAPW